MFGGRIMKRLVVVLVLFIASNACAEIYTWKDARGTVFYTNSLHEIPARYRSRAKLLDVASGKKSPITAQPAGGPAGPAAAPGTAPAVAPGQQAPAQEPRAQLAPAQPAAPASPAPASSPPSTPAARVAIGADPQSRLNRVQRRAQQRQNRARGGSQEE